MIGTKQCDSKTNKHFTILNHQTYLETNPTVNFVSAIPGSISMNSLIRQLKRMKIN